MNDKGATSASDPRPATDYDVVVIGGAFAGSAFATLLNRCHPGARILVIEKSEFFSRKVGEATVEISALFLHRVLGLFDYLSRCQLPKHGLRYWFYDRLDRPLDEMTEVGPMEVPKLASFQLDRALLDQHLFETAGREGCDLARPARVVDVELAFPRSTVTYEGADGEQRTVSTRWVIDASGRQAFIARKLKIHRRVEEHPTASIWARFHGVKDMDGAELLGGDPRAPRLPAIGASRRLATNHFCGYGWWCWVIPLSSGQTSIGVVYNKELYQPGAELPESASLRERLLHFVHTQPGLRELTADAEIAREDWGEDFMALSHLPYKTDAYAGKGWALVADAASFLDPYYSPGLDHASMSIFATMQLVEQDLGGKLDDMQLAHRVEEHSKNFVRSYDRWLRAIYLGKYELMGDSDLLAASTQIDTALYYLGVVTPVTRSIEAVAHPAFGLPVPQTAMAFRLMQGINQRLTLLARFRRRAGTYGKNNALGKRYSRVFKPGVLAMFPPMYRGCRWWFKVELERFFHWLRHGRVDVSAPVPTVAGMDSMKPAMASAEPA